jgi:hypothetical protein
MTPTEALDIIRQKVQLPKGVSARIDPTKKAVLIGTLDLVFAVAGPSLAHDEEYLLSRVKQGLFDLERVRPEHEQQKADAAKAEALVQQQKLKRKK